MELRGLAVAIYPEIQMLKVRVAQVRDGVADSKKRYGQLFGQNIAWDLRSITSITVPPMLERNTDKLFLLGEVAGPSCIQLVRFVAQYDEFAERLVAHIVTLNAEQWQETIDQLDEHLALLDGVIDKCEMEVRPIHNSIKG